MKNLIIVLLILCFSAINCGRTGTNETPAGSHVNIETRPFRVLVIIGDQWTDPMSYSIDPTRGKDEDLLDVVTMLKIWGVPFDILRLDEQRLQINRFLDSQAKANYGCMIWMADPKGINPLSANYETLKNAVNEYGISLIALSDYIKAPVVAELCGINVKGINQAQLSENGPRFALHGNHFIT